MDRHKPMRNPYFLISGISGYILLAGFINVYPPDSVWRIGLFLLVLTLSTGLIIQYVFRRLQQSVLLSFGLAIYLILRLFDLRNPVYAALLVASIVSLEITLRKR